MRGRCSTRRTRRRRKRSEGGGARRRNRRVPLPRELVRTPRGARRAACPQRCRSPAIRSLPGVLRVVPHHGGLSVRDALLPDEGPDRRARAPVQTRRVPSYRSPESAAVTRQLRTGGRPRRAPRTRWRLVGRRRSPARPGSPPQERRPSLLRRRQARPFRARPRHGRAPATSLTPHRGQPAPRRAAGSRP